MIEYMTPQYTMIDLCSGLGGASEAFVMSQEWEVLRIENNPLLQDVPRTILMDIRNFAKSPHMIDIGEVDLIWFSPPCREFSNAFGAPRPKAKREGIDFHPDMEILECGLDIISKLQPKYFVVENVMGAIKDFEPYLGSPQQIIGPFVLWGAFPHLNVSDLVHTKYEKDTWSTDPLRANKRGMIPFEISMALYSAFFDQKQLTEWL